MENCIFCKIVSGEIPSYKIYEDEKAYAFLDIAMDSVGHTLVIPKAHCQNILNCETESLTAVIKAVQKISVHYTKNCGFTGVNVLCANGAAAGQSVGHLHFHIIPRKDDDKMDLWPLHFKLEIDLGKICDELKIPR